MWVPDDPLPVAAGSAAEMLADACAQCGTGQESLINWRIEADNLVLLLANGRKVRFAVIHPQAAQALETAAPGRVGHTAGRTRKAQRL